MSWDTWDAVDEYTAGLLVGPDPVLEQALEASAAAGLPAIAVTANQGKLLQPAGADPRRAAASSRSARSAATARSGSRGRCRRRDAS